jgi:hypothetical protein
LDFNIIENVLFINAFSMIINTFFKFFIAPAVELPEPQQVKAKKPKKKVKKPKEDDVDEITRKLLDMDVTKTELEKFDASEFEIIKPKEEPKEATTSEPQKLVPIKIERKLVEPTKAIVSEPEQPLNIVLRKAKVTPKKVVEETKLPTVLLKSRIVRVEFPPEIQNFEIVELNTKRGKGEMIRVEEEETEVKKPKKVKKFKAPKDEKPELEEVEIFKDEQKPKETDETDNNTTKYERKPKELPQPEVAEEKTLKLGKGKIPVEELPEENVKLKKIPEKTQPEEIEDIQLKPKPKEEEQPEVKPKKKKEKQVIEPLKPFEPSESEPIELEKYEKVPEEIELEEKPENKEKYKRKPKKEDKPEDPQINIVPGIPKPTEFPEELEVNFRIPQKLKEESKVEPIKLKPFDKPKDEEIAENKPSYEVDIKFDEKPTDDQDFVLAIKDSPDTEKPKKKTRKPKKISEADAELERLLNLEIEKTELEKYEKIDLDMPKKQKADLMEITPIEEKPEIEEIEEVPKKEEAQEEVLEKLADEPRPKLKLPKTKKERHEKPEEKVEDTLETILQRKLKRREFTKEVMEEKTQEPQFAKLTDAQSAYEAELENIRRRLSKVSDSAESEISERDGPKPERKKVKKIKKKNTADMDAELERLLNLEIERTELEVYEKTELELSKRDKPELQEIVMTYQRPEKPVVQNVQDEDFLLKIKRKERSETPDVEEFNLRKPKQFELTEPEEATIKLKPIPAKPDDESEEAVFEIKKPTIVQQEDVEVVETVKRKKKPKQIEEEEAELSIKKPAEVEEDEPEETGNFTFGVKKNKPKFETEDVEVVETIKKKKKPKVSEEAATEFSIKKPKKPKVEEDAAEFTIKKTIEQPEEIREEVTFGLKKKIEPIFTEDVKVVETIRKKKPKVSSTEEAEGEIVIKKPRKPKVQSEEAEVTMTKTIEGPEPEPIIEEEIIIEEGPEDLLEEFVFKRKPKPKRAPQYEEHEEEVTIKKLKPPRKPSRPDIAEYNEPENVTFRPKRTTTKEDVEQEFKISLDSYQEEEISMSGKIKLKKPKPVYNEDAGEHRMRIIQHIDDDGPVIEEIIDEESEPEDTMYDVDEPDEFSEKETIPKDLPEDIVVKLKRKKEKPSYKVHDYEEESFSIGFPRKKSRQKISSYDEDSLQLRLKRRSKSRKYIEGMLAMKKFTNIYFMMIHFHFILSFYYFI